METCNLRNRKWDNILTKQRRVVLRCIVKTIKSSWISLRSWGKLTENFTRKRKRCIWWCALFANLVISIWSLIENLQEYNSFGRNLFVRFSVNYRDKYRTLRYWAILKFKPNRSTNHFYTRCHFNSYLPFKQCCSISVLGSSDWMCEPEGNLISV